MENSKEILNDETRCFKKNKVGKINFRKIPLSLLLDIGEAITDRQVFLEEVAPHTVIYSTVESQNSKSVFHYSLGVGKNEILLHGIFEEEGKKLVSVVNQDNFLKHIDEALLLCKNESEDQYVWE